MKKNKKKNKLLFAALSLVIAIMLWMVALNEQNPTVNRSISNISVNIAAQSTLAAKNLVILEDNIKVSIKIKGAVFTVGTVKASDIKASIDVSGINTEGVYELPVSISGLPSGAELNSANSIKVTLTVDKLVSVNIPVSINTTGALEGGISVFSIKSSLASVKVTGAETVINTINNVSASVNLNNITADTTVTESLTAYTQSGEVVDNIRFSKNTTDIEILTGYLKNVELKISVQGKPASGYAVSGFKAEPNKVNVITRNNNLTSISVVVVLAGKEKTDIVMLAQYNIDEDNVVVVNPPKINVTVTIKSTR
ncbi:MAG: CdaR family protein [Eubacteriaceae bacterium]